MSKLDQEMDRLLPVINSGLDGYLSLTGKEYDSVLDAMRYSVMNAGKRIRPVLALEFCRLSGGEIEDALPFACAVEMIHCYSLIHDDLPCMDDDDLRRGKPSCHKQFGEATALLAGDALLTRAFEVMSGGKLAGEKPALALAAIHEMASYAGVCGMIGGQAIDLASEGKQIDQTLLREMHNLKTSALIKAACKMGALAAGAQAKKVEAAQCYGENLGLAFQMVDDILDVIGTEEQLGKPIGSDHENGKVTFVSLYGLEKAEKLAQEYTQKALDSLHVFENTAFLQELTQFLLKRSQ